MAVVKPDTPLCSQKKLHLLQCLPPPRTRRPPDHPPSFLEGVGMGEAYWQEGNEILWGTLPTCPPVAELCTIFNNAWCFCCTLRRKGWSPLSIRQYKASQAGREEGSSNLPFGFTPIVLWLVWAQTTPSSRWRNLFESFIPFCKKRLALPSPSHLMLCQDSNCQNFSLWRPDPSLNGKYRATANSITLSLELNPVHC